jgi:hypothetical protein
MFRLIQSALHCGVCATGWRLRRERLRKFPSLVNCTTIDW